MVDWHDFVRPFFGLVVAMLTAVFLSAGTVFVVKGVGNLLVRLFWWVVAQIQRFWHFILFVVLTLFFTSILFGYIMREDAILDRGIDLTLVGTRVLFRAFATYWPAPGWCGRVLPRGTQRLCQYIDGGTAEPDDDPVMCPS